MAWVEASQAVDTQLLGPFKPNCIATLAAPILTIIMGIKKGLTFCGPRLINTSCCSSKVEIPPIPEPKMTPERS